MPYVHRVTVQASDIDELGHASNLVYLRWVLEAALAHSASLGLDHAAYRALGHVFVVRKHVIEYARPALLGEELVIETRVVSWGAAQSERRTRILRDGVVLCRASTDWAWIESTRGRPARIPPEVRDRFPLEPEDPT